MKEIELPFAMRRPILACGADSKGAFALAHGKEAFLADGFGDLSEADNLERYGRAIKALCRKMRITPKLIACDMHPGYFSTRFAGQYERRTTNDEQRTTVFKVQHHEAHVASAMADNGISGDVIGVAFDGTGFGSDGNIWGGEFFTGLPGRFKRVAHLEYMPMPGGEMAVREPGRMAASYLYRAFGENFLSLKVDFTRRLDRKKWIVWRKMIDRNINSPLTSSVGRLFDAVASLVLCKEKAAFEAELPMELERMIAPCDGSYRFDIKKERSALAIDTRRMVRGVAEDLARGEEKGAISAKFHNTVAEMILKINLGLKKASGIRKVVLSGGVFQNAYLAKRARLLLEGDGFKVYPNSKVPANDGGIPLGQLAIAAARGACA
jgi:hydrogenase maturation protein HypF